MNLRFGRVYPPLDPGCEGLIKIGPLGLYLRSQKYGAFIVDLQWGERRLFSRGYSHAF